MGRMTGHSETGRFRAPRAISRHLGNFTLAPAGPARRANDRELATDGVCPSMSTSRREPHPGDSSRETPVTAVAEPAGPSQLQHARGRPLGDLTWLARRLGTSGRIWLSTLPRMGRDTGSLSSGALRVLPRAA